MLFKFSHSVAHLINQRVEIILGVLLEMLHNVSQIVVTLIKQRLLKHTELYGDKLLSLLSWLVSNIDHVLSELFDCTFVCNYGIVFILVVILFEKTRLTTLCSGTSDVTQLLRHFPSATVVVKGLFDSLNLLSDVICHSVNFS